MALFPERVATHDPLTQELADRLRAPSSEHLFGTDKLGRDIFSRVIFSSRLAIFISVSAVALSASFGVMVGILAGYYGRWTETLLMRFVDIQMSLPQLLLAIVVVAMFGASIPNIIFVLALTSWPWFSRMFFNTVRSIREMEFITAARAIGASDARILLRHVLVNQWHVLIVLVVVFLRSALVNEATLSFLGLGVRPPTPSWGSMLREGYDVLSVAPWLSIYPGLVLLLVIYAINAIGEMLRRRLGE